MEAKLKLAVVVLLVAAVGLGIAGCKDKNKTTDHKSVSYQPDPTLQAQVDSLKSENERLRAQIDQLDQMIMQRNTEIADWKQKYNLAQRDLAAAKNMKPTADPDRARLEAELIDLQEKIKEYEGIIAKRDNDGNLVLVLDNKIFFRSGSAELNANSLKTLGSVSALLNEQFSGKKISVDGHCDSDPIRSSAKLFKTNWELSSARSLTVLHFLKDNGVTEERLSARAFSFFAPVAPNDSAANKAKNRRVEIVILDRGM